MFMKFTYLVQYMISIYMSYIYIAEIYVSRCSLLGRKNIG